MLHVVLLILKIIGIVLLVILGILLTLLLLILLVPVRYRIEAEYQEKTPGGMIRITWLLHALSVLVTYDGNLDATVKVLGRRVYQLSEQEKEQEEGEADGWDQEDASDEQENRDAGREAETAEKDGGRADQAKADEGHSDGGSGRPEENGMPEASGPAGNGQRHAPDSAENGGAGTDARNEDEAIGTDSRTGSGDAGTDLDREAGPGAETDGGFQGSDGAEKAGRPDFSAILEKIQYQISDVCDKLKLLSKKRRWVQRFLENPRNQKTIRLIWRQLKAIIRHALPRKLSGHATFGFDDPATTGKVLAAGSILYVWFGVSLSLTPDFEHSVLMGDLDAAGRIRLGTVTVMVARVLVHKNFWKMIKKIKKFLANGGI